MKKIFTTVILGYAAVVASAQPAASPKSRKSGIGLKAGYNYSYLTGSKAGFDPSHNNGFMIAGFFSHGSNNGLGYRSELVFSRQGYSFDEGGKNTDVMNDYLYMPHLVTYTIAKVVQVQAGAQVGVLLNAKTRSASKDSSITGLMNRFDYGFAGGIEIYPFKGFIIGGRYNLGLGKLYKKYEQTSPTPYPLPFNPSETNLKNGLFQFFAGYRF